MDDEQNESFRWHPQSQLRSISNTGKSNTGKSITGNNPQQTIHKSLSGVQYITEVDCENTLRCLRNIITNRQEFCVHPAQYQPEPESQRTEQAAFFQCLSAGTNGVPKRIRRTHQSWISSFRINAQLANIGSTDSYAIIGRLSHSLALYAALEASHLGADLHALTDLRPDNQLKALAILQSSILYATPTQLRLLCKQAKSIDSSQLFVRHIFCGGGKLDQATAHDVQELFQQATLREFYGASETSFISLTDEHTPSGSVGKPYPGVEIAIGETPNTQDSSGECATGEIWVKSPYVFHAYADNCATAACWQAGFISVGEMGYFDKNGYLFLAGRQSRRVNIADTVVYPEEVENALHAHAAVSHCAVVAVEDTQRGCVLMAVVEADDSVELKKSLLVYLRQCVGPLKAPRDIVFVSAMPLLASGKPDLRTIKRLLSKRSQ